MSPAALGLPPSTKLKPTEDEAAALSLLLVGGPGSRKVAAGSLLTGSLEMASTSWRRWRELQPRARRGYQRNGFDIGPNFYADPFPGVRILREIVQPERWQSLVDSIDQGSVLTSFGPCVLRPDGPWSSIAVVGRDVEVDSHRLIGGVMRPVSATFAPLAGLALPPTENTWSLEMPYYLPRGRDRGRMVRERDLLHWPEELLGIEWLGGPETELPAGFSIGRVHEDCWIADVTVDHDADALHVSIAWDAARVDPYSCSLIVRAQRDGGLLLCRQIRISDLPNDEDAIPDPEPRSLSWKAKLLGVRLPRGPRNSEWGVMLIGPDGALLDELPVARRVERIDVAVGIKDAPGPFSEFTIGDSGPPATPAEQDEAVAMVAELEDDARKAAARRRITTGPQLATYLRRRFSCREGELLVFDPYFFNVDRQKLVAFLADFDRPVRVLTAEIRQPVERLLGRTPWLEARPLPKGVDDLHDRVWIVGETAVLVGNSIQAMMSEKAGRTTSASELPAGDSALWRQRFETWWERGSSGAWSRLDGARNGARSHTDSGRSLPSPISAKWLET
ncbi:MAG TPA: hypothetical protein VIM58_04210 [Candidatus Methylacidiphilales bacterium]